MEEEFKKEDITPELIAAALNFLAELSDATIKIPKKSFDRSDFLKNCLNEQTPLTFNHLEPTQSPLITPEKLAAFQALDAKSVVGRKHLRLLRSFEEILALKKKSVQDLIESLYVNIVYRGHVALYSQVARLGGISEVDLLSYYPQDKDFANVDLLSIGKEIGASKFPDIVSTAVAEALSSPDPSIVLALLNTILCDMLNNTNDFNYYLLLLKDKAYSVVYIHGTSPESRLLKGAQKCFYQLLNQDCKFVNRLLKHYQYLDHQKDEYENLPKDYLQDPSLADKTALIAHLRALFPKKVIKFRLIKAWACTLVDGNICVSPDILSSYETEKRIIQIMLTLLHELAHLKKFIYPAEQNYLYKTPESMKSHTRVFMSGSTGSVLEKNVFGGRIYIENVSHELSNSLINHLDNNTLTEAIWIGIENELKQQPPKVEEKLVNTGCGNQSSVKSLSMCKSFNKFHKQN